MEELFDQKNSFLFYLNEKIIYIHKFHTYEQQFFKQNTEENLTSTADYVSINVFALYQFL